MLKGDKIYFKPVEKKDLEKRIEWINNSEIQLTLNYNTPISYGSAEAWYNRISSDRTRKEFSIFCIHNDEYIGFCGLINIDPQIRKGELHCVIGEKRYHNGGYGTESYKLLTEYAFLELGLNKVYGYQLVENSAAHRVVEKLGWKRDGCLRDDIFSHGMLRDRYVVSILRNEWIINQK